MKPITLYRRRRAERDRAVDPAGEPGGEHQGGGPRRPRAALAAVVAGCVAVAGVAITGAGNATPGLDFLESGQWIYNSKLGKIFHVDGGTQKVDLEVDAQIPDAGPGTQVVENDKSGYVLARGRVVEFGKSELKVADPILVPTTEQPVGLMGGGAAFAVYKQAGAISRFGDKQISQQLGGAIGEPVVTPAGTLWVHRPDTGDLCQLPLDADRLTCSARAPIGHSGALTVVGDGAVFVDTTARTMQSLTGRGLGNAVSLAEVDMPRSAMVAPNDVDGRLAIVNPESNELHLVDAGALTDGKTSPAPITRKLPKGKYDRLASSGSALALLDESTSTLVTVDRDGKEKRSVTIPKPAEKADQGPPDLIRGEDSQVYVKNATGQDLMVMDDKGAVDEVKVERPKPVQDRTDLTPPPEPTLTPTPTAKPTVGPTIRPPSRRPPVARTQQPTEEETSEPPPVRETQTPEPKKTVDASRPGAPASVVGRAGDGSVAVTWRAAAGNGAPITGYRLTWGNTTRTVAATDRRATVTNLTNGTGYVVTVRAVNRIGPGPGVNTARLYPGAAPGAPVQLTAKAGDGKVTLDWGRPDLNGGTLRDYQVQASGLAPRTVKGTSLTLPGLTNGRSYTFEVHAVARTRDNRTLSGRTASVTAKPKAAAPTPLVRISRGPEASGTDCDPPDCAAIHVRMTGFAPNTWYDIKPWTTNWGNFNEGVGLKTDANGVLDFNRFKCAAVGQQVWVTVENRSGTVVAKSPSITWTAG